MDGGTWYWKLVSIRGNSPGPDSAGVLVLTSGSKIFQKQVWFLTTIFLEKTYPKGGYAFREKKTGIKMGIQFTIPILIPVFYLKKSVAWFWLRKFWPRNKKMVGVFIVCMFSSSPMFPSTYASRRTIIFSSVIRFSSAMRFCPVMRFGQAARFSP